jgi:hypothetical protein
MTAARESAARSEDAVSRAMAQVAQQAADTEDVAVELPNGSVVGVSPPKRSTIHIVTMIAAELTNGMEGDPRAQIMALTALQPTIESLLYIRSIDGQKVGSIMTGAQYTALADRVTDGGIRRIQQAIQKHWPVATPETLGQIKKNLS